MRKPVESTTMSAGISRPFAVRTERPFIETTASSWTSWNLGLFIAAKYLKGDHVNSSVLCRARKITNPES